MKDHCKQPFSPPARAKPKPGLVPALAVIGGSALLVFAVMLGFAVKALLNITALATDTRDHVLPLVTETQRTVINLERLRRFGEIILTTPNRQKRRETRLAAQILSNDAIYEKDAHVAGSIKKTFATMQTIAANRDQQEALNGKIAQRFIELDGLLKTVLVIRNQLPTAETPHQHLDAGVEQLLRFRQLLAKAASASLPKELTTLPAQSEELILEIRKHFENIAAADVPEQFRQLPAILQNALEIPRWRAALLAADQENADLWATAQTALDELADSLSLTAAVTAARRFTFITESVHHIMQLGLWGLAGIGGILLVVAALARRHLIAPIIRATRGLEMIQRAEQAVTIPPARLRELDAISRAVAQLGAVVANLNGTQAELHAKNIRLNDTNAQLIVTNTELQKTLETLQTTQKHLIESEKMAALGELVAGIAHEINTPLGAIRASIDNIVSALDESLRRLPQLLQQLTADQQRDFFALVDRAAQPFPALTSKEERACRKVLRAELAACQIDDADSIADTFVEMGIYEHVTPFLPLLQADRQAEILKVAYNLSAQRRNSMNILTAVERASKIVFALKSYAHFDHSERMTTAKITDGLEVVLTLYQNQLKAGIEVHKHYEAIPAILCYPDELIQVWINLVSNALHAMRGKGRLDLTVAQQAGELVVQITDSGGGIPADIQARLFQPFFTTKPTGEGSGLGLHIARKIIATHQGRIEVESQPGNTTFRVFLPIRST